MSGLAEPVPAWDKYRRLHQAVQGYLDHEPEDPAWNDIWRALGAIMGEYQRDAFAQAFDPGEPAEQACIRRLITGDDECPHSPLEADSDPTGPPHSLLVDDHSTLWLDNESDEPEVYSMYFYPGYVKIEPPSAHVPTRTS